MTRLFTPLFAAALLITIIAAQRPAPAAINLGGSVADTSGLDLMAEDPHATDDCGNPFADINALTPEELIEVLEETECSTTDWYDEYLRAISDGGRFLTKVAETAIDGLDCAYGTSLVLVACGAEIYAMLSNPAYTTAALLLEAAAAGDDLCLDVVEHWSEHCGDESKDDY